MAQAYDSEGNPIGQEVVGDSMREVFDKVLDEHKDASEIRVRKLLDSVDEIEAKTDRECYDIVQQIDARLGGGWTKNLAEVLSDDFDLEKTEG